MALDKGTRGKDRAKPKKPRRRFADLPKPEQQRRITAAEKGGRLTHEKAEAARGFHGLAARPTKQEKKFTQQLSQGWAGSVAVARPGAAAPTKPRKGPQRPTRPEDVPLKDFAAFAAPRRRTGTPTSRTGMEVARAANWALKAPVSREAQEMLARTRLRGHAQQVRDIRTGIPRELSYEQARDWAKKHPDKRSFVERMKGDLRKARETLDPRDLDRGDLEQAGRGALGWAKGLPARANATEASLRGGLADRLGIPEEGEGDWGWDFRKNLRAMDDLAQGIDRAAPAMGKALGEGTVGFGRNVATALSPGGFRPTPGRFGGSFRTSKEPFEAQKRVGRTVANLAGGEELTKLATGKGVDSPWWLAADVAGVLPVFKGIKGAKALLLSAEAGVNTGTIRGGTAAAKQTFGLVMGGKAAATREAVKAMTAMNSPSRAALHAEIDRLHPNDPKAARHMKNQIDANIHETIQKPTKTKGPPPDAKLQATRAEKHYRETVAGVKQVEEERAAARLRAEARGKEDAAKSEAPQPVETGLDPADIDVAAVMKGVNMKAIRGNGRKGVASLVARLPDLLERGRAGRYWYEQSAQRMLEYAGGNKALALKYAQVTAIYSAQRNPFENIELATEALRQIQAGEVVRVGTRSQRAKAMQVMNDIPWDGRKTDRFYKNMAEDIDYPTYVQEFHNGIEPPPGYQEVTNDIWQARLFGLKTDNPTKAEYAALEQLTRNIANELGWKPKQIQAALWGPIRADMGKGSKAMTDAEGVLDFSHALERESARLPFEAAPGVLTAGQASFDAYRALSPEARAAFDAEVTEAVHAFLRDSGAFALLKGKGQGLYELQTNPAYLALMPMKMTGKGEMGPFSREAVETVATMIGEALKQDATAWFRPKYMKTVPPGKQNGAKIMGLGRDLTEEEILRLRDILEARLNKGKDDAIGIPPEPNGGFYILNHTESKNQDFQQAVREALDEVLPDASLDRGPLYFEGKHIERGGKEYEQVTSAWGDRPAAQKAFQDLKDSVNATHQRHLGLDGPSDPPRRLRPSDARPTDDPGVLLGASERGPPALVHNIAEEIPEQGMRDISRAADDDPLAALKERIAGLTGTEKQGLRAKMKRYEKLLFKDTDADGPHTPAEFGRMYKMEVALDIDGPARQRVRSGMTTPMSEAEAVRVAKTAKKAPRSAAQRAALVPAREQLSFLNPGEVTAAPEIQSDDLLSNLQETLRVFGETGEVPTTKNPLTAKQIAVRNEEDARTEALLREMGGTNDAKAVEDAIKAAEKAQKPKTGRKPRPGQQALDTEAAAKKKAAKDPTRTASGRLRGKPTRMRAAMRELDEIDDFDLDREALEAIAQKHKLNADELRDFIEKARIKGIEPRKPAVSRAKPAKRKPRGRTELKERPRPARAPREFTKAVESQRRKPGASILKQTTRQRKVAGERPFLRAVDAKATRVRKKRKPPETRMAPRPELEGHALQVTRTVPRTPVSESPLARSYIEKMPLRWKGHEAFDQNAMEELFDTIRAAPNLTDPERNDAIFGLLRALNGQMAMNRPAQRALVKAFGEQGEYIVKRVKDSTPVWGHAKRAGAELYNLPRALMTIWDLSAAGRQAIMAIPAYPKQFAKNFKMMHGAFKDQRVADDVTYAMESHPQYDRIKKAGTGLVGVGRRELVSSGTYGERLPTALGGGLIRGSVRSFDAFLAKVRFDAVLDQIRIFEEHGRYEAAVKRMMAANPDASPERAAELAQKAIDDLDRQIALTVNHATGYGSLGKLEGTKAAEVMAQTFFSPRLMVSRLNVLNPRWYLSRKIDRRVRRQRIMGATKTAVAIGGTLYLLDQIDGVDAVYDPRSSQFGRVKFGDKTSIDITGGYAAPVSLLLQIGTGVKKNSEGEERDIGGLWRQTKFGGQTTGGLIVEYGRKKLAPVPGTMVDWLMGKDLGGNEKWSQRAAAQDTLENMIPLIAQDMYDIYKEHGPAGLGLVGPALYGFSPVVANPPKKKDAASEGPPTPAGY